MARSPQQSLPPRQSLPQQGPPPEPVEPPQTPIAPEPTPRPTTPEPQRPTSIPTPTPASTPGTTPAEAPCCCRLILWLDEIRIETLTNAGSIPVFSSIVGHFTADHVFVGASDGEGQTVTYPDDENGIKIDDDETAGGMDLFTLASDSANGCWIERKIKIFLNKESRFNKLLDIIHGLSAEIARITAEIARDSQAWQAAMMLVPPNMAAAGELLRKIAENDRNLTNLTARLSELLKLLTGTDDTLMDQFSILVAGELKCGDKDWIKILKEPAGWKWDPADPQRAILDHRSERLGGIWHVRIAARRLCPPGHN